MPRDGWVAASFTKIVEMKLDFLIERRHVLQYRMTTLLPTINRPRIIYIGARGRLGTVMTVILPTVMVFFSHSSSRSQD